MLFNLETTSFCSIWIKNVDKLAVKSMKTPTVYWDCSRAVSTSPLTMSLR